MMDFDNFNKKNVIILDNSNHFHYCYIDSIADDIDVIPLQCYRGISETHVELKKSEIKIIEEMDTHFAEGVGRTGLFVSLRILQHDHYKNRHGDYITKIYFEDPIPRDCLNRNVCIGNAYYYPVYDMDEGSIYIHGYLNICDRFAHFIDSNIHPNSLKNYVGTRAWIQIYTGTVMDVLFSECSKDESGNDEIMMINIEEDKSYKYKWYEIAEINPVPTIMYRKRCISNHRYSKLLTVAKVYPVFKCYENTYRIRANDNRFHTVPIRLFYDEAEP